jgi:pimeloyl-ACP methyl ester carboxylesterase
VGRAARHPPRPAESPDPKQFLFFTRTANGKRAGKAFLARLQERTSDRDTPTSLSSYLAQLKACRRWGKEEPHDLSRIRQPVLLANGDNDRMLPTPNTLDMARRLPNNELVIYPDAGHGGTFQFHEHFVEKALEFLAKQRREGGGCPPVSGAARATGIGYSPAGRCADGPRRVDDTADLRHTATAAHLPRSSRWP